MPWTWGDPIDENTDVYDVGLWNQLLAAVHERAVACGYFSTYGDPIPDLPVIEAGRPDKHDTSPTPYDDFLRGAYPFGVANYPGGYFTGATRWHFKSVAEMQSILRGCLNHYVRSDLYPASLHGLGYYQPSPFAAANTMQPDFLWNEYVMAQALGYPVSELGGFVSLWRRRRPRRIFQLTATSNQDYDGWYYFSGNTYWQLSGGFGNTLLPGDRAQFYDYIGESVTGPFSTSGPLSTVRVPGPYRGIYEYQGSGMWTPAPAGAEADILDSNNGPYASNRNWCVPEIFDPGDYFDWWLLRDIYECCKLLKWTYHTATPISSDNSEGYYNRKGADMLYDSPSEAAAKASAESRLAGATADKLFHGLGSMGMFSTWSGPDIIDRYAGMLNTFDARIIAPGTYQGMARTVDFFAFSTAFGTYDNNGLPLIQNQWSKIQTKAFAAGPAAYGGNVSDHFGNYQVPTWGAANVLRGFSIPPPFAVGLAFINYYLGAVVKWNFQYA